MKKSPRKNFFAPLPFLFCVAALTACDGYADAPATPQETPSAEDAVPAGLANAEPHWFTNWDEAKKDARTTGRDIFFNFTGTSWCPPCIVLENKILSTEDFKKMAGDFTLMRLTVERVPADNSEATLALLREFRVDSFPTVLLADSAARPYAVLIGASEVAADYLARVSEARKIKVARDENFLAAEKTQGFERVQRLDAALKCLEPRLRLFYPEIAQEIASLDPEDRLGFGAEAQRERRLVEQTEAFRAVVEKCVGENGERTTEACIHENIALLEEFLSSNKLEPQVRQAALKFLADSYAFLRSMPQKERIAKIRERYIQAVEAAPETKLAATLKRWIVHYSKILEVEAVAPDKKDVPAE